MKINLYVVVLLLNMVFEAKNECITTIRVEQQEIIVLAKCLEILKEQCSKLDYENVLFLDEESIL